MEQQLLPLVLGSLIVFAIGSVTAWKIASRLWVRLGTMATLVILVSFASLSIASSQNVVETVPDEALTVVETTVVVSGDLAIKLNATGTLASLKQTTLVFENTALVEEVLVETGDMVQAGDVLATLDTTDAEANLRNAQLAEAEAQAALDALLAEPRAIDVAVAEAAVTSATASLSAAAQGPSANDIEIARLETELAQNQLWQSQLNRDITEIRGDNIYAQEIQMAASLERADINIQVAEANYNNTVNSTANQGSVSTSSAQRTVAEAKLEDLLNGPTETALAKAQIDLETAQLDVQMALDELEGAVLVAPYTGLVVSENLTVGTLPAAEEAITLIDLTGYTIDLNIDETDISHIALGKPVSLSVNAFADEAITGTISSLAVAPTINGQLVTYTAEVVLDGNDVLLRPGMSATASILIDEVENVITVPNRFIQIDESTQQQVVTVQTAPDTYTQVPVTLGLRNTEDSQIVDGLEIGQTIVLLADPREEEESNFGLRIPGTGGSPGGGPGGRG